MRLVPLFDFELRYTFLELVDYGVDGQFYGMLEGTVSGDRLRGTLRMTNLARRRADNANLPALRGLLETGDGEKIFVEMNGIAMLRPADQARVFATTLSLRTGAERYEPLNRTFAVIEGVLDRAAVGGVARGRAYECEVTVD